MDYNAFLELVKNRRSIRRFKPDAIPDEYVDKIIEAARWAPSGFNSQPWEFVVVRKRELKDRIVQAIKDNFAKMVQRRSREVTNPSKHERREASLLSEAYGYRNAPVFIILYGDMRTKVALPVVVQSNEDLFRQIYISSLASAFLYMHLAAAALGFASQWVTSVWFPPVQSAIKELLGIPEELAVYDMMATGFSASKPRPKVVRDREEMVHYDYCEKDDFRTNDEVNDFAKKTKAWTTAAIRREGID